MEARGDGPFFFFCSQPLIDLFTDAAAILNQFDLRSIIGCPGGMSKFRALSGTCFLNVFLE